MPTIQEYLSEAQEIILAEKTKLLQIQASIERCEKLPTVTTHHLLNLPVKVG